MNERDFAFQKELAVRSIRDFLDGIGGDRDWDIFTSISLKDSRLDAIRRKALAVDLPLDDEGRVILENLLTAAQSLDAPDG
jgi:hypothetical protein